MPQTTRLFAITCCLVWLCPNIALAQAGSVHTKPVSSHAPSGLLDSNSPQNTIRAFGLAVPKHQVYLRAGIDGHVDKIDCEEGQFVKQGDVIIEMDCRVARAGMKVAKLESEGRGLLETANAELAAAKINYEQHQKLRRQNATSKQEFNDASLRLERARAAVRIEQERLSVNQARYELAQSELSEYFITAPFDGQVVEIQTSPGAAVTKANDLVQIVSLDFYRVELYLPVHRTRNLKMGQTVSTMAGGPYQQELNAVVAFVSPMIEAATGTTRVVLEIDNRELKLPAGFTVSIMSPATPNRTVGFRSSK